MHNDEQLLRSSLLPEECVVELESQQEFEVELLQGQMCDDY